MISSGRISRRSDRFSEELQRHLLESEELDNPRIDARVETEPSLVRPKSGIEFDPVSFVDLDFPFVIDPVDAEQDLALGFHDPFDDFVFAVFWVFLHQGTQRFENLFGSLIKFGLRGTGSFEVKNAHSRRC